MKRLGVMLRSMWAERSANVGKVGAERTPDGPARGVGPDAVTHATLHECPPAGLPST